jgi:hypothetical protein
MSTVSIADLRVATREIARRAGSRSIRVVYDPTAETASADRHTIVLPVLEHPVTAEYLMYHRYRALHELGHHWRPDAFDMLEKVGHKIPQTAFWCWNLVEDEAQEAVTQAKWSGDRVTLEDGRAIHVHRQLSQFRDHLDRGETPSEQTIKQLAAYTVALSSRWWHRGVEGLVEANMRLDPNAAELARTLMDEGWAERIAEGGTVAEMYDVGRDLYRRLYPDAPETPTAEEVQQMEPGEGEENQGDEGESDGEAQQNPDDGDPDDSSREQGEGEFTIDWRKLLASDHKAMGETKAPGKVHIKYENGYSTGDLAFFPDSKIKVLTEWPERNYRDTVPPLDNSLGNQLRRYVQSTNRATWEGERMTGRINKRALKRIVIGTEERHRRVFQRRTDAKALNTAITVLVDCSGSMGWASRYKNAAIAAGTLLDGFAKALRLPVEVIGHSFEDGTGPLMYVAKSFRDRKGGHEVASSLIQTPRQGNADGDALMWAAERLRQRPEKRKILVMIADGQPTDCDYKTCPGNDAAGLLKLAVEEVQSTGVELYGIGVGYRELEEFIPNSTFIEDGKPISPVLIETCERFVLKN